MKTNIALGGKSVGPVTI